MNSWGDFFYRSRKAIIWVILLFIIVLGAVFAPFISSHSPTEMHKGQELVGSSEEFLLGTDQLGRDLLSRILHGARVSLIVGISSVAISVLFGIIFGLVSGYFGKWIDAIIMRMMDILFAFPDILLALAIIAVLGPGTINTILAIGIVNIPVFTRIVRGSVLSVKSLEYVESARAIGAKTFRIMFREILPNVQAPILVQGSIAISGAILTESALSFLGLGIQPPSPSWGGMIAEARRYMELAPGMIIWPSIIMTLTILSFNMFGDALRDMLDPNYEK